MWPDSVFSMPFHLHTLHKNNNQKTQTETQQSLTNRAMRLEISQGHQTRYHAIR